MKRLYEMLVIIDQKLDNEKIETTIDTIKGFITENKGEISEEEKWGVRKLAYELKRREEGYYMYFEYSIEPDKIPEIKNKMRLKKEIMRFMILKKE